ncbi:META domain-containing protein [uncultured Thiothrix sp.]|uniref:META domain-containing protein n=1 Tax=uncultured Thiothrix sp. TaxID=223185 RepID=UPI002601C0E5|nr:META domain-containing protein [uncultured Thiothrix sp.]
MIKKILGSIAGQLFIVLMALAIMSACSMGIKANDPAPQAALDKTSWQLTAIEGKAIPAEAAAPTLQFENGRLTGFTGCNRLFASYVSSSTGSLALSALGTTKMACMGTGGELERAVLKALAAVNLYALPPGQLNLLDANHKVLLTYIPEKE